MAAPTHYSVMMTTYVTADDTEVLPRDGTIKLHGPAGFDGMRKAGRLAASILDALVPMVQPGVTTGAIDDVEIGERRVGKEC